MEDRAQKEKSKKAAEKAELEIKCATKVCSPNSIYSPVSIFGCLRAFPHCPNAQM